MEPEQELFRTPLQIENSRSNLRRILRHGIASRRGTIEANAACVGAVVIDRGPIRARPALHPRPRAVVVTAAHQMMQAERRHVVHDGLVRSNHHRNDGLYEGGIVGEGHSHPVFGDCVRLQRWIPREPAERVPVGLIELRARPVTVTADVGNASHARAPY